MKNVVWFKDVSIKDVPEVGGKNASLGEMYVSLTGKGVRIPNGFAITAGAYQEFLKVNGLDKEIAELLKGLNVKSLSDLEKRGAAVRKAILNASIPEEMAREISEAYHKLSAEYKTKNTDVAVRSSATAEDLPGASFAGQQETYLNVVGEKELLLSVKKCFASLFTNRAISYREDKGFSHLKTYLSVGVQKMVRSDKACSGVAFTLDPDTGFRGVVVINGSWGLGEMIVQGEVVPDEFHIAKEPFRKGFPAIIMKELGSKEKTLIYGDKERTRLTATAATKRSKFVLEDKEILQLADWCLKIEEHYKKPMDIEWAKDGVSGKLFIVQARPETVHGAKAVETLENYVMRSPGKLLVKGAAIGSKIAEGPAKVIKSAKNIGQFKKGEVLVTRMTDPDWEPIMKIASAIVTDEGGRTCFSGETNILTDKGFISFGEVYKRIAAGEKFNVLSYDYGSKSPKWKKVLSSQKNRLNAVRVSVSQTGNTANNTIDVTSDHKFYTYENRRLIKKPLKDIIENEEAVCLVEKMPEAYSRSIDNKLAYLLGALATDGNVYLSRGVSGNFRRGQITFTQKESPEKQELIADVNSYFAEVFGKRMTAREKFASSQLRGRTVVGTATDFRCYSLEIALQLKNYLDSLPILALSFSENAAKNFLAGVIDGDGSFYNNRLQIYASKKNVLQAVVISCLRLGIVPQITSNRNIYNVQIVEKMGEILSNVRKTKLLAQDKKLGTKLFAAKQVIGDVVSDINYKGRIKPYVQNNSLIDARKIKDYLLPLADAGLRKEIEDVLNSSLRMQRVKLVRTLGKIDVFNVEVEADNDMDHNYVVFTNRLTPVLVSNSHAAIVSRELGIPCVVGTETATKIIKKGTALTVDCSSGTEGFVWAGKTKWEKKIYELRNFQKPRTKIMVNIGSPDEAYEASFLPADGVGLAREEFIIAARIKAHPLALLQPQKADPKSRAQIRKIIAGYRNGKEFYVSKLAEGVAQIGAAFYPHEVIVRFSDFKTNEYAALLGGKNFEPREDNPMIGWRGASRYYDPRFKEAFGLECRALKKVREEFGLANVTPMIPFCRTPEEGRKVIQTMSEFGLKQGENGLKVYAMAEIPANMLLADEFLDIFDGFSIGSNDLTQLTVGIDRDNTELAKIADERNEAVKISVGKIIEAAKKKGKYVGICGQAPSDYEDFATFLVEKGIGSISLNPDSVVKTAVAIKKKEEQLHG